MQNEIKSHQVDMCYCTPTFKGQNDQLLQKLLKCTQNSFHLIIDLFRDSR